MDNYDNELEELVPVLEILDDEIEYGSRSKREFERFYNYLGTIVEEVEAEYESSRAVEIVRENVFAGNYSELKDVFSGEKSPYDLSRIKHGEI